ncbi:MAG: FAD binding domain-containing protein [Candidatus Tyrphobacter sp.]
MWSSVYRPASLDEALRVWRDADDETRLIAGGTDLIVEQQRGIKRARHLIDLCGLQSELKYVRLEGDEFALGALATHNDVLASRGLAARALPLVQASIEVGAPQIRSRGTIAGNLVTASPANDTISPLLALDARLVLASGGGEREVALSEFYPAFRRTVLRRGELVREIRFRALGPDRRGIFLKLGLRRAQAISVINVAVVLGLRGDVVESARVALGCVAPTVVRLAHVEESLCGRPLDGESIARAARIAADDVAPIDDLRGSAGYRKDAVAALVARALERLASGREAHELPGEPILLETAPRERAPIAQSGERIVVTLNGEERELTTAMRKTLLDALRDAGCTGVKEGCAEGECGACTVWLDGRAVMSCLVAGAQANGCEIVTIEGLAKEELHALQQAYIARGAVQCGFCIPGMLMAGAKLLDERPSPTRADCQVAISGNLCRCTGYRKILDAMEEAALARTRPQEVPA